MASPIAVIGEAKLGESHSARKYKRAQNSKNGGMPEMNRVTTKELSVAKTKAT